MADFSESLVIEAKVNNLIALRCLKVSEHGVIRRIGDRRDFKRPTGPGETLGRAEAPAVNTFGCKLVEVDATEFDAAQLCL